MREPVGRLERDIRGRDAEGASEAPAGNDLATNQIIAPKTPRRGGDVALLESLANRARGHDARRLSGAGFDFRHDLDGEAVSQAGLGESGRRTGSALAEMKVPADDDGGDAKASDKNLFDELVRAHRRERGVKAEKHDAVEPEPGADFRFVTGGRQSKRDRPPGEKVRRMRLEGQDGAGGRLLPRHRDGALNNRPMPEMQAVKISDGVDRAFQPMRRRDRVRGQHEAVGHCALPIPGFDRPVPAFRKPRKLPWRPDPVKAREASAWASAER